MIYFVFAIIIYCEAFHSIENFKQKPRLLALASFIKNSSQDLINVMDMQKQMFTPMQTEKIVTFFFCFKKGKINQ